MLCDAAIFTRIATLAIFHPNRTWPDGCAGLSFGMSEMNEQNAPDGVKDRLEAALTRLETATEQALGNLETAKADLAGATARAEAAETKAAEAGEVSEKLSALEAENASLKAEISALTQFASDVEARLDGVIDVVQSVIAPVEAAAQATAENDDTQEPALELSAGE